MTNVRRPLLDGIAAPIRRFFNLEAASGIVLLGAAVAAVAWANSPFGPAYQHLFERSFPLAMGGARLEVSARSVITDGLMTLFFFLVGMEIKREAVEGELRSPRRALLPAVAALGGMLVPAALFRLICGDTPAARAWGIPIATDIAFCLGAIKLLGARVPRSLVVFVTALAIFDDVGGILVIAVVYGHGVRPFWVLAALALAAALVVLGRKGVRRGWAYAALGALLWGALGAGGVHPTIAGVLSGLAVPARRAPSNAEPVLDRYIRLWHPWVAFGIMPLFALASSGVRLAGGAGASVGRVTLAVSAGLFAGKQAGILGATVLAVKLRLAGLPEGASWKSLYGVSVLAGIGFTVSLFMAELSLADAPALLGQARVGIFLGSLASAAAGTAVLRTCRR